MATDPAHDEKHSSRKLIYWLGGLTVLFAAIVVKTIYSYPREQALAFNPEYIGTYCGLGLHDEPGYFGKNWFRIHWKTDDGIFTEVIYREYGYSPFRSTYPDDSLRYEGLSLVEQNGSLNEPITDEHDVLQAKYFSPDGRLLSEIKDATGIQTLCDAAGNVVWKLKLKNGKRREHWMFSSSGVILSHSRYDENEMVTGAYASNYTPGKPRVRGRYEEGYHGEIGRWYWFYSDGSLESITNHDTEPPEEQKFGRGERFPTEEERAEIRKMEAELKERATNDPSNTPEDD